MALCGENFREAVTTHQCGAFTLCCGDSENGACQLCDGDQREEDPQPGFSSVFTKDGEESSLYCYLFVALCCFLPLGIVAVLFTLRAHCLYIKHDTPKARRKIQIAKKFIYCSYAIGFVVIIMAVTIVGVIFNKLR